MDDARHNTPWISEPRAAGYRSAVSRAAAWLSREQDEDGSFGPNANQLADLETVAIALLLTGNPESSARALRYIERSLVAPDASLRQPADQATLAELPYAPAWCAVSAHLNGFYALAASAMQEVLRYQDSRTGGLFGHPEARRRRQGLIVPSVSAVAGIAALATGRTTPAEGIGTYFLRLLEDQPDLDSRLYLFTHNRSGLITTENVAPFPPYAQIFERSAPRQPYWLLGLIIAFLVDLSQALGDPRYLDCAITLFEFSLGCNEEVTHTTLSHKYAWGCASLYRATRDPRALDMAMQIGDHLVSIQEPDGSWWHSGVIPSRDAQPRGLTIDVTSQFTIWLVRTLEALAISIEENRLPDH